MAMAEFVLSTIMKHVKIFVVHDISQGNGIELTSNDPDYVPIEDENDSDNQEDDSSDDTGVVVRFDDSAVDGDHEDYFEGVEHLNEQLEHAEPHFLVNTSNPIAVISLIPHMLGNDDTEISDGYESESLHSMDGSSDDEQDKSRFHLYNPTEMCMDYKWKVGVEFTSISQFKEATKE